MGDREKRIELRTKRFHLHIVKSLGAGGMGATYLAFEDENPVQRFVVKMLLPKLSKRPKEVEAFLDEAKVQSALNEDHIPKVLWIDRLDDGRPIFAMVYVEGESLAERLRRRRTIPLYETCLLMTHVCSALHHAHEKGVVHRDVKPGNIMVEPRPGNLFRAYVIDWGVNRLSDDHDQRFAGTPHYAAPEQLLGRPVDKRADIFAVGAVLFEMLTGRRPFDEFGYSDEGLIRRCSARAPLLSTFSKEFPEWLVEVVAAALDPDPEKRPKSVYRIANLLDAYVKSIDRASNKKTYESEVGGKPENVAIRRAALGPATRPEGADYEQSIVADGSGLEAPEVVGLSQTGPVKGSGGNNALAHTTKRTSAPPADNAKSGAAQPSTPARDWSFDTVPSPPPNVTSPMPKKPERSNPLEVLLPVLSQQPTQPPASLEDEAVAAQSSFRAVVYTPTRARASGEHWSAPLDGSEAGGAPMTHAAGANTYGAEDRSARSVSADAASQARTPITEPSRSPASGARRMTFSSSPRAESGSRQAPGKVQAIRTALGAAVAALAIAGIGSLATLAVLRLTYRRDDLRSGEASAVAPSVAASNPTLAPAAATPALTTASATQTESTPTPPAASFATPSTSSQAADSSTSPMASSSGAAVVVATSRPPAVAPTAPIVRAKPVTKPAPAKVDDGAELLFVPGAKPTGAKP